MFDALRAEKFNVTRRQAHYDLSDLVNLEVIDYDKDTKTYRSRGQKTGLEKWSENYKTHWKNIVDLGLAALIMEASQDVLNEDYALFSLKPSDKHEAQKTVFTSDRAAIGRTITSSQIVWMDPDRQTIESIAFEDPTLLWASDEDPKVSHKLIKLGEQSEDLKPYAEAHLPSYPSAADALKRLRDATHSEREIWMRRPEKFCIGQADFGMGWKKEDENSLRIAGIGIKRSAEAAQDTKGRELSKMPPSFSRLFPRPGEDMTPKEVKEAQAWVKELNSAMEERIRAAQAFIGEAKVMRLKVRNGSPLLGHCEICPINARIG